MNALLKPGTNLKVNKIVFTSPPGVFDFESTSADGIDSITDVAVIGPSFGTVKVVVARTVSVVLI